MSKDVVSVATLVGSTLMLRLTMRPALEQASLFMRYCITLAKDRTIIPVPKEMMVQGMLLFARCAGPLLAMTIFLTVVATMAQTRMLVSFELIKPKFSKLNPISGFKNLFSLKSVVETLKNLLKISILFYIVYTSLREIIMVSERYLHADIYSSCAHVLDSIFKMLLKVILGFTVLAAADFLYQLWDFERQMKMTKQEVKEEYKQTEGDPQIKSRIKQKQREMAQQRMMQNVPGADVVVRNPTHVAVALRYHPGEDAAPIVLAKGLDYLALRIVKVAEEHNIVTVENKPLARALYAQAELERMIPPELYEAVAEVMVYLYKMDRIQAPADMAEELRNT